MSDPTRKPRTRKLQSYEALYLLNRCFEATLLSFKRLEQLRLFSLAYLNEYTVILELLRSRANEELTDTLHENEQDESAHFDQIQRKIEKERQDPDDVFLAAQARKRELRRQADTVKQTLSRKRPRRMTR